MHTPTEGLGASRFVAFSREEWSRLRDHTALTLTESDLFALLSQVPGLFAHRIALLQQVEHVHLEGSGHNPHHDRPEQVAALIERFLS